MIYVYADDALVYASGLDDYALLGLTATVGTEIGGTASIIMPQHHPAYNRFVGYRTVVTIYRDGVIRFRGRALYPTDDFNLIRTITCEGERCFLRDAVIRPYVYQDGPAGIFADVIAQYNAQVDPFKQFVVGTVTVTDPNNYVRLESENAQQASEVIDKLVERCGGYIVFTTNADGQRVINWYDTLGYRSSQTIEFGENLLDFARSSSNADLATVIIPYGARDDQTGSRLTIASVNDGLDFIQDYDAVALRGVIAKSVIWDDITLPENLLAKAQQYLHNSRLVVTALELTAVDLSDMDKSIDTFQVGDIVRVRSLPHGVNEDFELTTRTYDLLNPGNGKVKLGKNIASLSVADAVADKRTNAELQTVARAAAASTNTSNSAAIEEVRQTLTSLIQQTSDEIRTEVAETYATNSGLESLLQTSFEQLSDSFTFTFEQLQAAVDENDTEARTRFEEISSYIRFEDGNIILGVAGNELILRIQNDRISFLDDGAEVAYLSNKRLYVTDGQFLQTLRVGSFEFRPRANGNLSLMKVVE